MDTLTRRGFEAGGVGNAASRSGVKRVQVWIVDGEETAGRLVARNFGPKVKVVVRDTGDDLADGVDVVVGNALRRVGPVVRSVRVGKGQEVCLPS